MVSLERKPGRGDVPIVTREVLLALDQGTTSTRAIAFDRPLLPLHVARPDR